MQRIAMVVVFLLSQHIAMCQTAEDTALEAVMRVKEVKQYFYRTKTFYKQHPAKANPRPALMMAGKPGGNLPYYWVKVGRNDDKQFTTEMHFCVKPHSYEVRYYDVLTDSMLTLRQWRNNNIHRQRK